MQENIDDHSEGEYMSDSDSEMTENEVENVEVVDEVVETDVDENEVEEFEDDEEGEYYARLNEISQTELLEMWRENPITQADFHEASTVLYDFGMRHRALNDAQLLCYYYLDKCVVERNINDFLWFLVHSNIALVRAMCFCFLKDYSERAAPLLVHIGDWPEAIDLLLSSPICLTNPAEFHSVVWYACTSMPHLLSRITDPRWISRAPITIQTMAYCNLCVQGYFEQWYQLFLLRQRAISEDPTCFYSCWWDLHECVYWLRASHPEPGVRYLSHPMDDNFCLYGDQLGEYVDILPEDIYNAIVVRQREFLRQAQALVLAQRQTIANQMVDVICRDVGLFTSEFIVGQIPTTIGIEEGEWTRCLLCEPLDHAISTYIQEWRRFCP